jgi:transposase
MPHYLIDHSADTLFVGGSLESLLPENSVARVIWDVLSELDFSGFDHNYRNDEEGRPAIDPRRLAGVWIVAMVRGISSSMVVERLCETDIEMRWMSGDAQVHKSTLCQFRKAHIKELSHLSTQILAALARSGMLPGEELAIDGTVIRAAASCNATCTRGQLKRRIEELDTLIETKLVEPDAEQEKVRRVVKRKARLERALAEMTELGLVDDAQRMTVTEPEASLKKLKNRQFAPAHNVQVVTDTASGAIVSTEVVEQANDQGQLLSQVNNGKEELERVEQLLSGADKHVGPVKSATADSAYHDTLQLVKLEGEMETYVPDGQTTRRPPGVSDEFLSEAFHYDPQTDTMICPQGHPMKRRKMNKGKTAVSYEAEAKVCKACPLKSECCPRAKGGRTVNRPLYQEVVKAVAERVNSERGRRCKMARWVVVEGAFARLVELMNWRRCRTWGKAGAQAEALWRQITHNLMVLIGRWKPLVLKEAATG